MTGGRVKRVARYIDDETFCLTYGDGVGEHRHHGAHRLPPRHGRAGDGDRRAAAGPLRRARHGRRADRVNGFREKPNGDGGWINGGFFVLEPERHRLHRRRRHLFEREPLQALAEEGQLAAYRHDGFWQNMDTLRDKQVLEDLWDGGEAPWKCWD